MNNDNYLKNHFLTTGELLQQCQITLTRLAYLQKHKLTPLPSYILNKTHVFNSFFGEYTDVDEQHFYAKNYVQWINEIRNFQNQEQAFKLFKHDYQQTIDHHIKTTNFFPSHFLDKNNILNHDKLNNHIKTEWSYFLDGTYGVCTVSGLAKDIAIKEINILIINEITNNQEKLQLAPKEKSILTQAVNHLDQASSQFAPHERQKSSRYKYIEQIQKLYDL